MQARLPCFAILPLLLILLPTSAGTQTLDDRLRQETDRLLISYAESKNYSDRSPRAVAASLTEDRRATFHAAVRAMFTEILDRNRRPTGYRLIDLVDAVTGIWGLRPGDDEGRHQFRLSLIWSDRLHGLLSSSGNFKPTGLFERPHVLMPDGDDDPTFTAFTIITHDVRAYRQVVEEPKLQVAYLERDNRTGEVDIDFDTGFDHLDPSNSDPLSLKDDDESYSHLEDFHMRYGFFSSQLTTNCSRPRYHYHGEAYYGTPNCRR